MLRQCRAMRLTRALAITLGMVLVLLLCFLPTMIECDTMLTFGLAEVLGAAALACCVVAGTAVTPPDSAWVGGLLGAGLYLLPGLLLGVVLGGWLLGSFEWYSLRILLLWPAFPVALASCSD